MKYLSRIIIILLVIASVSCQRIPAPGESIELAVSTENNVEVTIMLERKNNDQFFLSAIFTPLDTSLHLYSKEIPRKGVDGLGRPTLLELASNSSIKTNGELIESLPSQTPLFELVELLVYPAGPITLRLPILLPAGITWVDESVIVTYMACNEQGCRPPVEGKAIAIQVPGSGLFNP